MARSAGAGEDRGEGLPAHAQDRARHAGAHDPRLRHVLEHPPREVPAGGHPVPGARRALWRREGQHRPDEVPLPVFQTETVGQAGDPGGRLPSQELQPYAAAGRHVQGARAQSRGAVLLRRSVPDLFRPPCRGRRHRSRERSEAAACGARARGGHPVRDSARRSRRLRPGYRGPGGPERLHHVHVPARRAGDSTRVADGSGHLGRLANSRSPDADGDGSRGGGERGAGAGGERGAGEAGAARRHVDELCRERELRRTGARRRRDRSAGTGGAARISGSPTSPASNSTRSITRTRARTRSG